MCIRARIMLRMGQNMSKPYGGMNIHNFQLFYCNVAMSKPVIHSQLGGCLNLGHIVPAIPIECHDLPHRNGHVLGRTPLLDKPVLYCWLYHIISRHIPMFSPKRFIMFISNIIPLISPYPSHVFGYIPHFCSLSQKFSSSSSSSSLTSTIGFSCSSARAAKKGDCMMSDMGTNMPQHLPKS